MPIPDQTVVPPDVPPTEAAAELVRAFYDGHPYPPPVADLETFRKRWADEGRRRADHLLFWPARPFASPRSILVAGCGTAQAPRYALREPDAVVVGIDVSAASLDATRRLQERHGLGNLELHQLAIENVAELGRTFDLIVCTGVLHHLPDPRAGFRALRTVMSPHAAMHVMVYAPYGRAGVYLLQEYCRRLGIGPSAPEIRDLAASLKALPPDHPFRPLLRHAPDLQYEAGLADALLHPQDRPYSVPQFLDLLDGAGMRFGRWIRQAPYLPQCGALAASPHRSLLASLPAEELYAAVELFRGTMVRHSAVAYRDDVPAALGAIDFVSEHWLSYVPVRVPDTLAVKERLPPGAAAVLINPKHTYTDIYLPVGAQELALVEAIDGRRTIRDIAQGIENVDAVGRLFERLWWYDQVVFDTVAVARIG